MVGVNDKCAEEIIESDIDSNRFDYLIMSNKQFITGDYGTGKTYTIRLLFLKGYLKLVVLRISLF